MKLLIKKKYFEEIKAGKKTAEFREAHITFICEETGEQLRKEVESSEVMHTARAFMHSNLPLKDWDKLFKENWVIVFKLK